MTQPDGIRKRKDSLSDDYDSDDSIKKDKEINDIVEDIEKDNVNENGQEAKLRRIRCAVRDWGESSSCHGIPHMAQANTLCAAIVWSVILAFCAVGFVYLFSDTLAQYLRFEKIVQLNNKQHIRNPHSKTFSKLGLDESNFPSVTFCNTNPYKRSKIQMVPALQALMTVYEASADGSLT